MYLRKLSTRCNAQVDTVGPTRDIFENPDWIESGPMPPPDGCEKCPKLFHSISPAISHPVGAIHQGTVGVAAGRGTGLGAKAEVEAGRGTGLGAETEAGRGEGGKGSEFL